MKKVFIQRNKELVKLLESKNLSAFDLIPQKDLREKLVELVLNGVPAYSDYESSILFRQLYRNLTQTRVDKIRVVVFGGGTGLSNIIGGDIKMQGVYQQIVDVAQYDFPVHLFGETGTGKELVARAIHDRSERASGPFIVLDCGAVPGNLLESEIFGHEKGAFTGAHARRIGLLEEADRGTLFIDEVGELPIELQPKLLRALDQREIRRLGARDTVSLDIRVVAATNRDLAVEVNRGSFREDLFYRLSTKSIHR